jgi:hypothetical protein
MLTCEYVVSTEIRRPFFIGGVLLKAQQKFRVIKKFAVQNLERHGAITYTDLLGEEDRAHAARAQAADNAKTSRKPGGKLRFSFRDLGGKARAVTGTEGKIVRISVLASRADFHERQ